MGQVEIEVRRDPKRVVVLRNIWGSGTAHTPPDRQLSWDDFHDISFERNEIDAKSTELVNALFSPLANCLVEELSSLDELSVRAFAQTIPRILSDPLSRVVEPLPSSDRKGMAKLAKMLRELAEFMDSEAGRSALFYYPDGVIDRSSGEELVGDWKRFPQAVVRNVLPTVHSTLNRYRPLPSAAKTYGCRRAEDELAEQWKHFIGRRPGRSKSGAGLFDRALGVIANHCKQSRPG